MPAQPPPTRPKRPLTSARPTHRTPSAPTTAHNPARKPVRLVQPLSEAEIDELQARLDQVPAPLEALDVSMLDGFLCGLLVQPRPVAAAQWLLHITDVDGRALPMRFNATRLHELALRRHGELQDAITRRQWFDPWVFELEEGDDLEVGDEASDDEDDAGLELAGTDAVYPWVAGFATALELFPELMALDAQELTAPLALIYRHLGPDDLEDADELLAEIETLEPPADLSEAVEGLVRATLLLADVAQPVGAAVKARLKASAGGSGAPGHSRRLGPSNR
jgi:uncharacterized protein